MRYRISRIEKITNGVSEYERCDVIVSDLEKFRNGIDADEVHFVYETID